ncbi:DUF4185 domain-containing protein [Corynebacterium choanae]|uniref:DUF4185 domain-containing protein n=1 Tax=Corynebacterium choanae TaxID=1862358 RepID=A0A3G6J5V9_9CORY|nr:DUF4185 domain-containing protein [Corynebacterium choanae]AZA13447.1 hypothetical protein CCHOA_05210 [Corynebacterium choanae]
MDFTAPQILSRGQGVVPYRRPRVLLVAAISAIASFTAPGLSPVAGAFGCEGYEQTRIAYHGTSSEKLSSQSSTPQGVLATLFGSAGSSVLSAEVGSADLVPASASQRDSGETSSSFAPPWLTDAPGKLPVLAGHTQAIGLVTGPGSPGRTDTRFGVGGTDLGIVLDDGRGGYYLIFGDTTNCGGLAQWRSNVALHSNDTVYADGVYVDSALTANGWASQGFATEFIPSLKLDGKERTTIPTGAIRIGDTYYVDYMSVREWGTPGNWDTNYAATVKSTDMTHWTVVDSSVRRNAITAVSHPGLGWFDAYRPGDNRTQMTAFVLGDGRGESEDGYVYRFSTPAGRSGAAYLSRIPADDFPDEQRFSWWDGQRWLEPDEDHDVAVTPALAAPVLPAPVSEVSVSFNEYLGQWIALYNGLQIATADRLEGPWSRPTTVISAATIPDLYGTYVLPGSDGKYLYYVATTWSNYNAMVMRTDLSQLRLNSPAGSRSLPPAVTPLPHDTDGDGVVVTGFYDYRTGDTPPFIPVEEDAAPQAIRPEEELR